MQKKDVVIGFAVGIISSLVGAILYSIISGMIKGISFNDVINQYLANNIISKVFSLGAILNLVVFFLFIRKRQDNKAKGVLIATLLVAFASMLNRML